MRFRRTEARRRPCCGGSTGSCTHSRDWVHRFNAAGPDGLLDKWTSGPKPRLSPDQLAEFARIVETGPDRKVDGLVRWRRIDLKRAIAERRLPRPLRGQASQETGLFPHERAASPS